MLSASFCFLSKFQRRPRPGCVFRAASLGERPGEGTAMRLLTDLNMPGQYATSAPPARTFYNYFKALLQGGNRGLCCDQFLFKLQQSHGPHSLKWLSINTQYSTPVVPS